MKVERSWVPGMLALIALPYALGLDNGFVWLDHREILDGGHIVRSPRKALALLGAERAFSGYFRPIYSLIHSFDHALWGPRPFGFHLSSLLLHLANAFFVHGLLCRCGFLAAHALLITALWGLHPLNTVVVGLVHAKADLAVVTCLSGTLWLATHAERTLARTTLALALVACALYTKETAFLFAPGLVLLRRQLVGRIGSSYRVGVFVLTAFAAVHHYLVVAPAAYASPLGVAERLATFGTVYVDYFLSILAPLEPSVADSVTRAGALGPLAVVGYGGTFALLVLGQIAAAIKAPALRPWLVLYHLALLPVAQIVPILHFRADRFLYVPTLAFVGAVVHGLVMAQRRWSRPAHAGHPGPVAMKFAPVLALLCAFMANDLRVVRHFRDDTTLFSRELAREPRYLEGRAALARHHERNGDLALAETLYRTSLEARPDVLSYVDRDAVVLNLSSVMLRQARWQEAYDWVAMHWATLDSADQREDALYNRAIAARRLGRAAEALQFFEDYLSRHAQDASAHYLAGLCAAENGHSGRATRLLQRYLALVPSAPDRGSVEELIVRLGGSLPTR